MTTGTREITAASLSVSRDAGHGGAYSTYRIDRRQEGYEVSATISRHFPGPGERSFRPSTMTQALHKEGREAADLLTRLARASTKYGIEAGRHHDAYPGLVEEFEQFFEAGRVARSFYESEIRPPEPPGRRGRLRRKLRYLASLFFNR
jgi:hypothetical protein